MLAHIRLKVECQKWCHEAVKEFNSGWPSLYEHILRFKLTPSFMQKHQFKLKNLCNEAIEVDNFQSLALIEKIFVKKLVKATKVQDSIKNWLEKPTASKTIN